MSGYLVARYLPEHGHQDGRTLWLIIALLTMYVIVCVSVCVRVYVRVCVFVSVWRNDRNVIPSFSLHASFVTFCLFLRNAIFLNLFFILYSLFIILPICATLAVKIY